MKVLVELIWVQLIKEKTRKCHLICLCKCIICISLLLHLDCIVRMQKPKSLHFWITYGSHMIIQLHNQPCNPSFLALQFFWISYWSHTIIQLHYRPYNPSFLALLFRLEGGAKCLFLHNRNFVILGHACMHAFFLYFSSFVLETKVCIMQFIAILGRGWDQISGD